MTDAPDTVPADTAVAHVAGTEPYPWPYDGRISGETLALVLAGWDRRWAGRAARGAAAVAACGRLAAGVAAVGGLVVAVDHGETGATAGRPGPPEPVDLVLPVAPVVVGAAGLDGLHGGPLDDLLRRAGRTHLLLAGVGLEGPVHSTLRSANDRGYECLLVTDACAPLDEALAGASAHTVTMSGGIFGAVGTADAVLAALADLAAR